MTDAPSLDETARKLADRVAALPARTPRLLVAVAGPPASGKTTLAERLAEMLCEGGHEARHVPMDGFHLDNSVIEPRGLLHRKGAPETFDAQGFIHAMQRLANEEEVILPAFDRARDIAVAGRIAIGPETRIAVVEGNYLCFTEDPWCALAELWQFSVFLDVPDDVLRTRLVERWRDHGLSEAAALARAEENDLPNGLRVLQKRAETSLTLGG